MFRRLWSASYPFDSLPAYLLISRCRTTPIRRRRPDDVISRYSRSLPFTTPSKALMISWLLSKKRVLRNSRWGVALTSSPHLNSGVQGRLHWGQYLTPQFTALKEHDPEYYASISAFKKITEIFDPDRMMWNEFMNNTIFSVVWLIQRVS